MLPIILIVIYIIGIPIWMLVEKKYFPYKEGDYTIEFDGVHEITPDINRDNAIIRSIMWPICLTFILVTIPILLLIILAEICDL